MSRLSRLVLTIALALGLVLGVAATTTSSASAAPEQVTAKATSCASQQSAVARARANHGRATRAVRHARNALRKAQQHHARKAVVVRKKRTVKRSVRHWRATGRTLRTAKGRLTACQNAGGGTNGGGGGTPTSPAAASPVQVLCDAGIPQEVCDALAGLVPTAGGDPLTATLGQLAAVLPPEVSAMFLQFLADPSAATPTQLTQLLDSVLALVQGNGILASLLTTILTGNPLALLDGLGLVDVLGPLSPTQFLGLLQGELGLPV